MLIHPKTQIASTNIHIQGSSLSYKGYQDTRPNDQTQTSNKNHTNKIYSRNRLTGDLDIEILEVPDTNT